ncbi:hypothetical protein V2J09_022997 [Rumex salicifolius]
MYRCSNTVIGFLNLLTLIASIPIIFAGLWMARSTTTCQNFLQTPLLWLGFIVLLVSLAGFIGACFHVAWALWFYLFVMIFLIAALMGFTVFGFVVTGTGGSGSPGSDSGGGVPVPGHIYKEYHFQDYSTWMKRKIGDPKNWEGIKSCVVGSKTCSKIVNWTPLDYAQNNLSPVQSGCCKPPTSCSYGSPETVGVTQDGDCYKWNNSPEILCYECDACKAGVMESIRHSWQKLSVVLVVMIVFLIAIYSVGCCAFRNARRAQTDYPYGRNRMMKLEMASRSKGAALLKMSYMYHIQISTELVRRLRRISFGQNYYGHLKCHIGNDPSRL